MTAPTVSGPRPDLPELLDAWVADGIISTDQAARIRHRDPSLRPAAALPPATVPPSRTPLVIEALAYLGSVIVLVGASLLVARYWTHLATSGRLLVAGVAAAGLLVAGAVVPARLEDVGRRSRSVLWLGAQAAFAGFLVIVGDQALAWADRDTALLVGAGAGALGALLWWRSHAVLQQLGLVVAVAGTAASATARLDGPEQLPGVAVWGVAVVWFLLGWGGVIRPDRVAVTLGAVGALLGAMTTMATDAGIGLALVTVAALVWAAVLARDLLLLGIAAAGALLVLPGAVTTWFPGRLAAPFALIAVGLVLVGLAVFTARRRVARRASLPGREHRAYEHASRTFALVSACVVGVGVFLAVLVLG